MRPAAPPLWSVAVVDFIATYVYAFAANALPYGRSGPDAVSYWFTQPLAYALITPLALVAGWRGVSQSRAVQIGTARWWRLSLEGAVAAAAPIVLIALFERVAVYRAIVEAAAFGAGLGVMLTVINLWLVRSLGTRVVRRARPRTNEDG